MTDLIDRLIDAASAKHGVSADLIRARTRLSKVAHARFDVWAIANLEHGIAVRQLARMFSVEPKAVRHGIRYYVDHEENDGFGTL